MPSINKTYVCESTVNSTTFIPLAQSTLDEKQLQYVSNTNNIDNETYNSNESKTNIDDSFYLSDSSLSKDINEDDENIDTNLNKMLNSTLDLNTSVNSSRAVICDDVNMYVETSDSKNLKQNMCPYCKRLQKQFARHLEFVHKNEEDVKKFRLLPKGSFILFISFRLLLKSIYRKLSLEILII